MIFSGITGGTALSYQQHREAIAYTLMETAKLNAVDPPERLHRTLTQHLASSIFTPGMRSSRRGTGRLRGGGEAQAGEKRLTEVLKEAGFSSVRRATDTPFNMIIEARP